MSTHQRLESVLKITMAECFLINEILLFLSTKNSDGGSNIEIEFSHSLPERREEHFTFTALDMHLT